MVGTAAKKRKITNAILLCASFFYFYPRLADEDGQESGGSNAIQADSFSNQQGCSGGTATALGTAG